LGFNVKPRIVVCIPAFEVDKTIAKVVVKAMEYADHVIVCDDGSEDLTGVIAERLDVKVIRHERRKGKGEAIRSLFKEALKLNPDIVVTLDSDGQHNPEEIPKLVEPILKGEAEYVIGSRLLKENQLPKYRMVGTKIINWLLKRKTGKKDVQSGFRAIRGEKLNLFLSHQSKGYGVEQEHLWIASKNNLKIKEVPITVTYKGLEKTSVKNPLSHGAELISEALRLIVEERPLLFIGLPGFLLILIGVALGAYLFWLFNLTRYFSIPVAIITLGTLTVGLTLTITALILYAIKRVAEKS